MLKPLNYSHRVVLILNFQSGRSCAVFVESEEIGRNIVAGVGIGATMMNPNPIGTQQPVMALVCPEDLISMREKGAPREVLEHAEALLESKITRGRDVLLELSPS